MRFGSVCSGIEAASVAWHPLGWEAAFFSEIEPFPSAVLAHHYPTVSNYGDMNAFASWPEAGLDVLVGGTPCQSFSVAGLRGGMADPRGNLALVYLALADRYRPRWIVWENVPGVLSSSGGRDFGAFLGGLGELGYGWAYRVLDAQFFGVPQRRRRVFVVGHLGDWRRAAAVLFEPASLRGDSPPSREARERIANALTERPDRGGGNSEGQRLVASSTSGNGYWREGIGALRGREQDSHENLVAPTISARTRGGGGLGTDFDCDGGLIAGTLQANYADKWGLDNQHVDAGCPNFVTHSLRADGFDASEDGTGRGTPLIAATLRSGGSTPRSHGKRSGTDRDTLVAFDPQGSGKQTTLGASCEGIGALGTTKTPAIAGRSAVRRLTPSECERLQGFPDDYTLTPYRGKPAADGPRYKALGNSMAVPVVRWIGERICKMDR